MRLLIPFLCFVGFVGAQELPDSPTPKPIAQERAATKSFWIASAAMAGSSIAPKIGGDICRHNNGVEPCTMHYGEYNAWTAFNTAANTVVWPSIFYLCRRETGNGKWCWVIPGGVVGFNVGWGIHEARIHHPDLTPESVIRRKR